MLGAVAVAGGRAAAVPGGLYSDENEDQERRTGGNRGDRFRVYTA